MKKILLFGETGMLGKAIIKVCERENYSIIGTSKTSKNKPLDLHKSDEITNLIYEVNPDIIINAAAIVNIEKCEKNPETAYAVNAKPVSVIAEAGKKNRCYFIQISTDHYYTGDGRKKHREDEEVTLLNEYARTKYAGEIFASAFHNTLIVRTNIVGFRHHREKTFVEWIISSLINKKEITLFDDYFISSIHVRQLADILFNLLKKNPAGILNIGSSEVFSKKEFITSLADKLNLPLSSTKTGSVKSSRTVPRAESDGLDTTKVQKLLGFSLPTLSEVVDSIKNEYREDTYAL